MSELIRQSLQERTRFALADNPQDTGITIILGDQSPWAGGLIRLASVLRNFDSVQYFVQDVDAPWLQDGDNKVSIKRGWPDYWALATRHPFSPEVKGVAIHSMRDSLHSPRGLSYLAGPRTDHTIVFEANNAQVNEATRQILLEEIGWATRVADWIGNTEGVRRGQAMQEQVERLETHGPGTFAAEIARWQGLNDRMLGSFVDMYKDCAPRLTGQLPDSYYWIVDSEGRRKHYHRRTALNAHETIVPKGIALPLEMSARGWVLGYTALGYLEKVKAVRNKYVPGLRLKTLQITHRWSIEPDPIEVLWEVFEARKQRRGQFVQKPEEQLQAIGNYWRARPTSISTTILGGSVHAEMSYREL